MVYAENVLKYYAGIPTYEEENDLLAVKKTKKQWHLLLSLNYLEIKNISRNFRRGSLTKATHEKFPADEVVKFSAKFERHPDGNANF